MVKLIFNSGKRIISGIYDEKNTEICVILCHSFMSNKHEGKKYDKLSENFKKKFAVFRFDFSGCGESSSSFVSVKEEIQDLKNALKFMKNKGHTKFYLVGYSLSGLIILNIKDKSVESCVLWAPLTDKIRDYRSELTKNQLEQLKKYKKITKMTGRRVQVSNTFFKEISSIDQKKLALNITYPILIIHGDKDDSVPIKFSENLVKLNSNCRLKVLKNEKHNFKNSENQLLKETTSFFMKSE